MKFHCCIALSLVSLQAFAQANKSVKPNDSLVYADEKHFKNLRQLTFGGDNAEAYFGFDNEHIVFQRTNPADNLPCDQIFY